VTRSGPSFLLLAVAVGGCVHHQPLQRRDQARGAPTVASIDEVPTCGYRVVVESKKLGRVEGELIAADASTLHVLDTGGLRPIPVGSIERVTVEVLPGHSGRVTVSTVLGTLSTISNGYFLLFTAPLWIISGTAAGSYAASRSSEQAMPTDLSLPAYARFPQGVPPGWPPTGATPPACKLVPTDDLSAKERGESD
jgi:hypothetical protein